MRAFRYTLFIARTWALPFVLGVVASTFALVAARKVQSVNLFQSTAAPKPATAPASA